MRRAISSPALRRRSIPEWGEKEGRCCQELAGSLGPVFFSHAPQLAPPASVLLLHLLATTFSGCSQHFFVCFLGHTWWCSVFTPGSPSGIISRRCSIHLGFWGSNLGCTRARHMPYLLSYHSNPSKAPHFVLKFGFRGTPSRLIPSSVLGNHAPDAIQDL